MKTEKFVRCCDVNKKENNIYYDSDYNLFRYVANDEMFSFCPWCGKLLDINLEMTDGETY